MRKTLRDAFPNLVGVPSPSQHPGVFLQDIGIGGAIACTETEALILDLLVLSVDPRRAVEIGSYVGWSSAHLAWHLDGTLDCIDNFTEGAGTLGPTNPEVIQRFWANLNRTPGKDRVRMWVGTSPEILPAVAHAEEPWELAFVDGWHLNGQPRRDVEGLLPFLSQDAAIVLHDLWMPDVQAAADQLCLKGFHMYQIPTPGFMGVFWRGTARWVPTFIARIGGLI